MAPAAGRRYIRPGRPPEATACCSGRSDSWPPVGRRLLRRRAAKALAAWTPADEAAAAFYAQFAGLGDLVFDIGANVGTRSKVFARLGCHVVAVEPQPDCAAILRACLGRRGPRAG